MADHHDHESTGAGASSFGKKGIFVKKKRIVEMENEEDFGEDEEEEVDVGGSAEEKPWFMKLRDVDDLLLPDLVKKLCDAAWKKLMGRKRQIATRDLVNFRDMTDRQKRVKAWDDVVLIFLFPCEFITDDVHTLFNQIPRRCVDVCVVSQCADEKVLVMYV